MLFISTGIFDDKLCPQILLVVPTANAHLRVFYIKTVKLNYGKVKDVTCGLTYHGRYK
jgi:hypothetical protein